ncbi:hypothetical protein J7E28_14010 [Microbacterium sp. ISL-108]|nr:hypothetical protein [Microbacterium sp. ISL-108]MBT2485820.1 hypothetical protein [Microbacterium sp. ISL-108]RKN68583.1 hypothetical protein D7252_13980 [Microbacterium sp. CGR2]
MGGAVQRIVNLGGGRGFLRENAAKSLHRIDKRIGHRCQITEALRSWAQQNEHWLTYKRNGHPIALHPDTPSVHQKGEAVDSDELQRFIAIAADHGFIRTVYRWVNGVWTLVERWHFEYFTERDNHRHEVITLVQTSSGAWHLPNPIGPKTKPKPKPIESEEDDMEPLYLYSEAHDRAFMIHPVTGKKRALPTAEYEAAKAAGRKFARGLTKAQVDQIPNG